MPLHFDPWWLPWQSPLKELQYLLPEGILVADEQGNVFLLPRHSLTAQTWIMQCLYRVLSVFHVLLMWFACLRNFSSELQQATFWKQIGSLHCTGMSFSGIVQCFQASTARVRRWNTIKYDLYDRTTCTTVRPVRPRPALPSLPNYCCVPSPRIRGLLPHALTLGLRLTTQQRLSKELRLAGALNLVRLEGTWRDLQSELNICCKKVSQKGTNIHSRLCEHIDPFFDVRNVA